MINTVTWFGELPAKWKQQRIKNLFTLHDERNYLPLNEVNLLSLYAGKGVMQHANIEHTTGNKAVNADGYKIVAKDDIIVNILLCWMGAIGRSDYDGVTSPAYDVYTPNEGVCSHYYHYLMRTPMFSGECYKVGKGIMSMRWRTYSPQFCNIIVPVPPRSEQDQIVRYLDWQVSKINKLIAAKKKEIALFKEHEKAIIQHYVFHGMCDKTVEKKSGVEWIGNIPETWHTTRIKFLFDMRDEKNFKPLSEVNLISLYTNLGVVQNSDITYKAGNKARTADNYKIVHEDDIIVNIILCWMGAIGRSAYNGVTSPAYDIYVPKENTCSRYYHYLFRLPAFSGECKKVGHGIMAMRWRTYSPEFRNIRVPEPPLDEQLKIADLLDERSKQLEEKIKPLQEEIGVLQELKNKLISDAVTGQIDVRGIEVPDFEYVEDIEESFDEDEDSEETSDDEEV